MNNLEEVDKIMDAIIHLRDTESQKDNIDSMNAALTSMTAYYVELIKQGHQYKP